MEWRGQRESDNVEDERGGGGGLKYAGFLGGGGIIIAVIYALMGGDPRVILNQLPGASDSQPAQHASGSQTATNDDERHFVGVVLADTEDTWSHLFQNMGKTYVKPHLVLYSARVRSACGMASSAVGPFYCPEDSKVYLDLDFFAQLQNKLGAKGEFARAYVVAHEIGHHVQHLLGETRGMGGTGSLAKNQQSVAIELQADCYAGVWAKATDQSKHILDKGDFASAISAAQAVGDDRLQQEAGRAVALDAFTHGSSAQRTAAFEQGFAQGNPSDCANAAIAH